jgi:hypothetical protein
MATVAVTLRFCMSLHTVYPPLNPCKRVSYNTMLFHQKSCLQTKLMHDCYRCITP